MAQEKEERKRREEIKNPGVMLNLTEKCTNIFPLCFDGFRVMIHRGLSRHFRVTHSIYLSSITPGNYRFGATYVGNKQIGDHENVPVVMGDIDSKGNMNAIIYHLFSSRFKLRLEGQMEKYSFVSSQLTAHYFGDTYTASVLLADPDLLSKSGCLLLQYLQSITPHLALGAEFAYMRNMVNFKDPALSPPDSVNSQVSLVGRYSTSHTTWSTVLSLHNILLCCYKQASEQIEFGVELNTNFRTNESVGSLAYQISLADRGIIFKGFVDTNTNVGSVFEKRVCGTPFGFSVSANLNHRSNNFRLGLGFIVE